MQANFHISFILDLARENFKTFPWEDTITLRETQFKLERNGMFLAICGLYVLNELLSTVTCLSQQTKTKLDFRSRKRDFIQFQSCHVSDSQKLENPTTLSVAQLRTDSRWLSLYLTETRKFPRTSWLQKANLNVR